MGGRARAAESSDAGLESAASGMTDGRPLVSWPTGVAATSIGTSRRRQGLVAGLSILGGILISKAALSVMRVDEKFCVTYATRRAFDTIRSALPR